MSLLYVNATVSNVKISVKKAAGKIFPIPLMLIKQGLHFQLHITLF